MRRGVMRWTGDLREGRSDREAVRQERLWGLRLGGGGGVQMGGPLIHAV